MRKFVPYGCIVFLSVLLFYRPFDGNADFYHHITAGRQIVTTHTFPYTDSLTFTAQGKPWINYAWGGGVIFYILFSRFGPTAVSVATAVIACLTLILLWELLRRYQVSAKSGMYTLLLLSPLLAVRFPIRPEIFMYPLIVTILLIHIVKKHHTALLWAYPVIILVWVNLYGSSALLGIGIIVFHTLWDIASGTIPPTVKKTAVAAMVLSVLAGFISPNGAGTLLYIHYIPRVASYEGEWAGILSILKFMPLGYLIGMQYSLIVYALTAGGILGLCIRSGKRLLQFPREFLIGAAILLPITAFRQTGVASILALPMTAIAIEHSIRFKAVRILLHLIIPVVIITQIAANSPLAKRPYNPTAALMEFLVKSGISGNALHQTQIGSTISYYRQSSIKTFVDTRDDLFLNNQSQQDLYDAMFDGKPVSDLLTSYPITIIIADLVTDSLNYRSIVRSPDWSLVYLSDRYMVLLPKRMAEQYGLNQLHGLDPYAPDGAQPGEEEAAKAYFQEELNRHPDSYYTHVIYGTLLQEAGNYTDAIRVYETAPVEFGPHAGLFTKEIHLALSILYAQTGQCIRSEKELYSSHLSTKLLLAAAILRPVPDRTDKALAWHILLCDHDRKKATETLQRYLQNPLIPSQEKIKSQILFMRRLQK